MNENQLDPNQADRQCSSCEQSFNCGFLSTAIGILDKESQNSLHADDRVQFEKLLNKLKQLDYQYPFSEQSCKLSGNCDLINELVEEAVRLIGIMQRILKI